MAALFIYICCMREKRWTFIDQPDLATQAKLCEELGISRPLAQLLAQRNITSFQDARLFFRPSLDQLHDPFLMKDMDRAVDRLATAIGNDERIMVYGDYDVDGTTSVAMMFHFLSSFYPHCIYYIPDRHLEGYGVSEAGLVHASKENISLIITLDCGIKSSALVDKGKDLGIDFIICDHHRPGDTLPAAAAVLDPKRSDCEYPYKELSGCGVGFKLIQAFIQSHPGLTIDPLDYLDLLVVSIAADIVPVTGENRILAYHGLQRLQSNPRPGLRAIMHHSQMTEVTMSNVVFRIAPKINSAGRIKHATAAVELMLSTSMEDGDVLARDLKGHNDNRRDTDELITREALNMIESDSTLMSARSTVLFKEDWHKGVIGIVASRCIEKYYRPTIILTRKSEDLVTGSARSVTGFDVYNALSTCSDLLEQFGGHMYAAGMTLKEDNVPAFQEEFERVVAATIREEQLIPEICIDSGLNFDDLTQKFYRILKQMAPFGPENLNPVFASEGLFALKLSILKEKHLKMTVGQYGTDKTFDAIGFGMVDLASLVRDKKPFRMAYSIEENHFRGKTSLQFMIKDIKPE